MCVHMHIFVNVCVFAQHLWLLTDYEEERMILTTWRNCDEEKLVLNIRTVSIRKQNLCQK